MSMPTKGKHHHLSHHHHPQHHSQPQQHHQPQQQQPHHTPQQHQHQIILNQPVVHSPQTYSAVVTTNTRFLNAVDDVHEDALVILAESPDDPTRACDSTGEKVLFEARIGREVARSRPSGRFAALRATRMEILRKFVLLEPSEDVASSGVWCHSHVTTSSLTCLMFTEWQVLTQFARSLTARENVSRVIEIGAVVEYRSGTLHVHDHGVVQLGGVGVGGLERDVTLRRAGPRASRERERGREGERETDYRSTPRGFHATFPRSTARGLKDPEKNDFYDSPSSPFSRPSRGNARKTVGLSIRDRSFESSIAPMDSEIRIYVLGI
ncbi:hypothetical protein ALC57_05284 [Trachymyrmex cornetzi]|uniref:Uncharacterized protein n=1 Tax=Trachymyrmex cornetzi TaxID=471704 RepID=A0A151JB81_9HYME|nr:hypothetical protein ALC57_05284 [Trachymyrmex cornetzi]